MWWLTHLPTTNFFLIDIIPVLTALIVVPTSHLNENWSVLMQEIKIYFAHGFYCQHL